MWWSTEFTHMFVMFVSPWKWSKKKTTKLRAVIISVVVETCMSETETVTKTKTRPLRPRPETSRDQALESKTWDIRDRDHACKICINEIKIYSGLAILWPTSSDIVTHSNRDVYAANRDNRQLRERNGQHLRNLARMRYHSRKTNPAGGLRLFFREFPEF